MLALRSQMNPHFVFNSLNSIRNLMIKDEKDEAINYLSNFSQLVRKILQQTQHKTIALQEEMNFIDLYIQVEKKRLNNDIAFDIWIDPKLELEEIRFPPMLLQPFVENAIWHGLHPSRKSMKELKIRVIQHNESHLEIAIADNGIGRARAESQQEASAKNSLSTQISHKRLELFNSSSNSQISMEIEDLADQAGTVVHFHYRFED